MGNSQNAPNLMRWLMGGAALAGLGVGLFLVIYFALSGVDPLPRLMIALCAPPLAMVMLLGGYILLTGKAKN
jgi:peptidoglycan/LPS O-acetylase OafA/YrhL